MDEGREVWRALYGSPDGLWLVLSGPVDTISPPHIDAGVPFRGVVRLEHLGDPRDVVTIVYRRLAEAFAGGKMGYQAGGRSGGAAVQQVMSEMLGVSQQSVSRYVRDVSVPDLTPEGWSNLVRAFLAEVPAPSAAV